MSPGERDEHRSGGGRLFRLNLTTSDLPFAVQPALPNDEVAKDQQTDLRVAAAIYAFSSQIIARCRD